MVAVIQNNFSRGEISDFLHARADLDHYRGGLWHMNNWVALRYGGMTRTPGTLYQGPTKYADRYTRFIPFQFRRDQTYAIEVGHQYFRFWNQYGQVHSGAAPYEIATPYQEFDLPFIQLRQAGDRVYIVCDGYPPQVLSRFSETNWTLARFKTLDGPYMAINVTTTTFTPSGTSGTVNITASSVNGINNGTGFNSGDVGRPIRILTSDGKWHWMEILSVASTTVVSVSIKDGPLPNSTGTTNWRLGAWSGHTGWPAAVGMYEDRLVFARTDAEPIGVWASVNGAYDDFSFSDPFEDDDGLSVRLTGGQLNDIQWLADSRDIIAGTEGSLRAIGRNDEGGAFTATNVRQRNETEVPCAYIPALLIENMLLFLDVYRERLHEAAYTYEIEGYMARELTAVSEHLFALGVTSMTYQSSPHRIIWCSTEDGRLLAATYDRDQEVFGVSVSEVSGGFVEHVMKLPGTTSDGDQLWMIVRRVVNGRLVRYVETLSAFYRPGVTDQNYPVYGNSAGVYQGGRTNTVTGIDHLEGETVGVWADGVDIGDRVVVNGEISLPDVFSAETIVFGLRQRSYSKTLRLPEYGNDDGSGLGRRIAVSSALVDYQDTASLEIGTPVGTYHVRPVDDLEENPYDAAVLRTGSQSVNLDSSWENNGVCEIISSSMHPATVRAITLFPEGEP